MNLRMNFRLAALVLAMGLMGVVIAYITVNSQREASDLQARLNAVDLESSEISNEFRESFRNLNNMVIDYGIDRNPATWEKTHKAGRDLDHWIDAQKFKMQNPAEKTILVQIDQAYSVYLKAINDFHIKIGSLSPQQNVLLSDYTPTRNQGQKLIDLSHQLAEAHLSSRDELLAQVHQTLSRLRFFTLASLGLLFLFAVALFVGVYQDLIAPLRVKLVESQAVAERREKLASLGLLAAGVAHEIRTPLTAIKAVLYLQKKKFEAGTAEHQNVEVVEGEIRRLERIIKDFIRFARPAEPQTAVLDVDILLLELQRIFTPQLGEANIQLIMETLTPMQIRADSAQIKQVMINLVQNAADSIGRDGRITLRARPDQKRLANNGEVPVVALEVTDTGKGIPPEVEKRLFDPFFTTKEFGHGLGLSIAAQIVQKHGGELEYQTMVNRGTTFGVILPRLNS
jgi:signal transduction histidine kinase